MTEKFHFCTVRIHSSSVLFKIRRRPMDENTGTAGERECIYSTKTDRPKKI